MNCALRVVSTAVIAAGLLLGTQTARAEDSAEEKARLHFSAGLNLLRDPAKPRYEEAYSEFKTAYALVGSYKILGNVAFCAMKLERDSEAIEAYTKYLAAATDIDPEERMQVERDLVTLKAGTAHVVLESTPDGASVIDTRVVSQGEPITNAYTIHGETDLAVRRGHHLFKARFSDGRELAWELDVAGGERHVFELPPEPVAAPAEAERPTPPERPVPKVAYVTGAATVAFGVGAIVTGAVALSTHSDFEHVNDGSDTARADQLRSRGNTLNVVSDVLLLGTVVGAAATAYLYFTRPSIPAKASVTTGMTVTPVGVYGRF